MGQRTITALKAQKRNPQRINVYLDGEFAFGLARIVAAWLRVGQVLDEAKIEALQGDDAQEVAFQQALTYLGYRLRSAKEVQQNLREHGFSEELIAGVLERLGRNGLVDDRRFARAWLENRSEFRPRSRRALVVELRQKGLSDEVIEQALEETAPADEDLAYQAALKHARRWENLEWPEFRRKLGGFLARRGFSYDIAAPVVGRVWAELRPEQPPGNNTKID
jgi:regulatory protein